MRGRVSGLGNALKILSKSCGTTSTALWLGELLGGSYGRWRQRLREWCYDAGDKKGQQRKARPKAVTPTTGRKT